ncbi:MAG: hypothetical protein IIV81_04140 [Clostridia bacterium]|nr:hypothetical protein [Clostridia bacterium]
MTSIQIISEVNDMAKKMMSLLVHLTRGAWTFKKEERLWDDEVWDYILEEAPKAGINTIVLDLLDGVEYATHPEIAHPDAWSRGRLRREIARIREAGMVAIPKLNFSSTHAMWLGEYYRMTSTPVYYKVVNDLIREAYELFDGPEYIHIGMDEEDELHCNKRQYCMYRQGELYWHDLRFLLDSVKATGAKPWIWSCPLFTYPDDFKKHVDPKELVISPWNYNALRQDHWTPIESRSEYVTYYSEERYKEMGIKFVEQDPFLVRFREVALPLMKEGYLYAPCASVFNRCDWNHQDLLEYFKENAPDDQIVGYMSAPWFWTTKEHKKYWTETFKFFKEAIDNFYPDNK